jgi:hypothetical protein
MVPSRFEIVQPTDRFVVSHQNDGNKEERSAGSGTFVLGIPSSQEGHLRHFEPTCPFGHGISNPTPYQARRPPLGRN